MAEAEYEIPKGGLPPEAYDQIPGERYPPYVPPEARLDEFTVRAVVVGIVLSIAVSYTHLTLPTICSV